MSNNIGKKASKNTEFGVDDINNFRSPPTSTSRSRSPSPFPSANPAGASKPVQTGDSEILGQGDVRERTQADSNTKGVVLTRNDDLSPVITTGERLYSDARAMPKQFSAKNSTTSTATRSEPVVSERLGSGLGN